MFAIKKLLAEKKRQNLIDCEYVSILMNILHYDITDCSNQDNWCYIYEYNVHLKVFFHHMKV